MQTYTQFEYWTTREFAAAFRREQQTVRKNLCLTGECFGIRPRKINGRLLWSVADSHRVLNGEAGK